MTPAKIKLRLIYWPFLAVLAGLWASYSLLYWWLVIELQLIPLGTILVTWIIPILLAIACAFIFLYKRVRMLALKPYRGNPFIGYLICVIGILAAPVIATQYLLIDAAGKLVELETPAAIGQYPHARYFTIRQYQPAVFSSHAKVFRSLTGKRKKSYSYDLIYALPLYERGKLPPTHTIKPMTIVRGADGKAMPEKDNNYATQRIAPAWICFQYHTRIGKDLPEADRAALLQEFAEAARTEFQEEATLPFVYLRRPLHIGTVDKFTATVQEATESYQQDQLVLEPVFEPFEDRYQQNLLISLVSLLGACGVMLAMVLVPALDYQKWEKHQAEKKQRAD